MKDLTGQRFGRLIVISFSHKKDGGKRYFWNCLCDCGNTTIIRIDHLKSRHTQSCGCLLIEKITKHGFSRSHIYRIWAGMIARCQNPKMNCYGHYGGRGISVCEEWLDFENFYTDIGQYKPSHKHEIDRINNDAGYSLDNCRWATSKENHRNTSKNIWIEFDCKTKTLAEWSEVTGIKYQTIRSRLRNGWSIERALTEQARRK